MAIIIPKSTPNRNILLDTRFIGLRAALFDLDGTLVRTFIDFPALHARVQEISRSYGTGEATQGVTDSLEVVARMVSMLSGDVAVRARREAFAAIAAIEEAGCADPQGVAGALALIEGCRARRVKIGIVTRNTRRVALDLLARMSLYCDVLVAREDVVEFKPHPAPVLLACAQLAVAPEETIMIGDLWTDIASGKAASVAVTVGIQWAHDPPDRFARCLPDITVDELAALLPLFGF